MSSWRYNVSELGPGSPGVVMTAEDEIQVRISTGKP